MSLNDFGKIRICLIYFYEKYRRKTRDNPQTMRKILEKVTYCCLGPCKWEKNFTRQLSRQNELLFVSFWLILRAGSKNYASRSLDILLLLFKDKPLFPAEFNLSLIPRPPGIAILRRWSIIHSNILLESRIVELTWSIGHSGSCTAPSRADWERHRWTKRNEVKKEHSRALSAV